MYCEQSLLSYFSFSSTSQYDQQTGTYSTPLTLTGPTTGSVSDYGGDKVQSSSVRAATLSTSGVCLLR